MSQRNIERTIGFLYLISTAVSMTGFALIGGLTESADYLTQLYPNKNKAFLGISAHLVNDIAVVGIGILIYSILKKYKDTVALTVLSTRIIEGTILAFGHISLFTLLTISKEYINAGASAASHFQLLGTLAQQSQMWSFEVAMLFLGIGGLVLSYFLYTSKSVPRWIALLGIVGYVLLFSRSMLVVLGYPQDMTLFLVGALFELIFPLWLIFKGLKLAPNA